MISHPGTIGLTVAGMVLFRIASFDKRFKGSNVLSLNALVCSGDTGTKAFDTTSPGTVGFVVSIPLIRLASRTLSSAKQMPASRRNAPHSSSSIETFTMSKWGDRGDRDGAGGNVTPTAVQSERIQGGR